MIHQRLTNRPDKVRVGEVLVQKGLITKEDLNQALGVQRTSGQRLGEVLIQQGKVTPQQLRSALTEQRRRNWTAIALFAMGTLVPTIPKLATSHVASVISPVAAQRDEQSVGGGLQAPWKAQAAPPLETYTPPQRMALNTSLAANPNPTVASPLQGFCHPLNGAGYLSQGIRGTTHRGRMEYAYDLATGIGTPVYAMRAGRVIGVQDRYPDTGGGPENISRFNYVFIEHDGGYRSAYIHLQQGFRNKVQIKAGDRVEAGQLIGFSGNSGWSTGPHLHVEIQQPGEAFSFTQTVPFAIAGDCQPGSIAQNTP